MSKDQFFLGPSTMMTPASDMLNARVDRLLEAVDHLEEQLRTLERYFHDRMEGHLKASHFERRIREGVTDR